MDRSLDSVSRIHKGAERTRRTQVNKAYRTLLAGVLSILFVGPALGDDANAGPAGVTAADGQPRGAATHEAIGTRYTGNEASDRVTT